MPVTVNHTSTPSVTLAQTAGASSACTGTPLTFTATAADFGGGEVTYNFLVDGASVQQSTSNTYMTSSLLPGTRTVACNILVSGGTCLQTPTATSAPLTVTILNTPPATEAQAATAITRTAAAIQGTITSTGCTPLTATGVEYSATEGFIPGAGTRVQGAGDANTTFDVALTNLSGGTTYYYRTYATNAGGTSYSEQQSFTTIAELPTRITVSPASGTYGETTALSATLTAGEEGISGRTITFTVNGIPVGTATTTAAGVATITNASLTGVPADTYPEGIGASFAGDAGYLSSNASASLQVDKASSTLNITVGVYTYNGTPQGPSSATGTGSGGAITYAYSGTANDGSPYGPTDALPVQAGTYHVTFSLEGDHNYTGASDSKDFTIEKAPSATAITITGAPFTFTGSAITPANVRVTGDGGLDETQMPVYVNNVNAGTAMVSYTYAGDANHKESTATATFGIDKATPNVHVTMDGPYIYNDAAQGPASATNSGTGKSYAFTYAGVNGTVYGPAAAPPVDAGDYTVTASVAASPDGNYNAAASVATAFSIGKAVPTIQVTLAPSYTYDGTAKAVQRATVLGVNHTFLGNAAVLYKQDAAVVSPVNAGAYTVCASFGGASNYEAASDNTKTLLINRATPTVYVTAATDLGYNGKPKDGTGKTTGVDGVNDVLTPAVILSYSGTGETIYPETSTAPVNAGTYTITASFAGNSNYEAGKSPEAVFTITRATPTVTPVVGTYTYDGTSQGPVWATNSGTGASYLFRYVGVNGTSYDASATPPVNAGDYTVTASVTASPDGNYDGASSAAIQFSIGKAATTTTVTINDGPFTYTGAPQTPATVTVTGPGGLHLAPGASYTSNVNAGTATASYSYAGDENYLPSSGSKTFVIGKANATITPLPYDVSYDGASHTATVTAKGVQGEPLAGLDLSGTVHTNAGAYTDTWSFTDVTGNYNKVPATELSNVIRKRSITVTPEPSLGKTYGEQDPELRYTTSEPLLPGNAFTGALHRAPGEDVGQYVYDLGTLSAGSNYELSLLATPSTGLLAPAVAEHTFEITQRDLRVSATGVDKTYDGTTTATVVLTSDALGEDAIILQNASATFDDPGAGNGKAVYVNDISIGGAKAANYRLVKTTATAVASIKKAGTTTTVVTSAAALRYMDELTMTATVVPSNTASLLVGSVEFFIGGRPCGAATVIPLPDDNNGAVQATLIHQVANLPGDYPVQAVFTSANSNYASGEDVKSLVVTQRDAMPGKPNHFYAGDVFAWTTGPNASKGTVTLGALLRDNESPLGDVRGAKATFYYKNGETLTPIPGAKDLPVGLVDINDASVGYASAIVQMDIGSQNAQSYEVVVGISGAYKNNPADYSSGATVTVSKPIPGGYICGGSDLKNSGSAGYIKGHTGLYTHYEFDIQYTKSGTNPKGKARVTVFSYYKTDGTLDTRLHKYVIASNAIASLSVRQDGSGATGVFSSKANLYEEFDNGTPPLLIEGGAVFQMEAYQQGCPQKIAITLYRKAGGIWYSNNWDVATARSLLQDVSPGSTVFVAGAPGCNASAPARANNTVTGIEPLAAPLRVTAHPNPSATTFTLQVAGGTGGEAIRLRVVDLLGRMVEVRNNVAPNSTLQVGRDYKAGIYLVEIVQGSNRQQLKLVKL